MQYRTLLGDRQHVRSLFAVTLVPLRRTVRARVSTPPERSTTTTGRVDAIRLPKGDWLSMVPPRLSNRIVCHPRHTFDGTKAVRWRYLDCGFDEINILSVNTDTDRQSA
jgi:hypothetical protein